MMRFQIRDLEQFSGVKAHTIRIWEKRYGLLSPNRTDTNIRTYDLEELKVILNVAYLNKHGHKISKIAALTPPEREALVRSTEKGVPGSDEMLNALVLAMLRLDEPLFEKLSADHEREHGFAALVEDVYVPLLGRIGLLWQSSSICPAQEHFASNLIRQRLIVTAAKQPMNPEHGVTHVLFLPENEIHELGLLYLHYLLRSQGKRTIYLGQSVPQQDLQQVAGLFPGELVLVTTLVVQPAAADALEFIHRLRSELPDSRIRFRMAGQQLAGISRAEVPQGMDLYNDMAGLIAAIKADPAAPKAGPSPGS